MVIIIGAGPAGLSMAHGLQSRNVPYLVLEKYDIGHSWREHYSSLKLHTPKEMSHLPDLPYPAQTERFPTREDFLLHQIAYAKHFGLNIRCNEAVQRLDWQHDQERWLVHTDRDTYDAQFVVAASGIWSTPYCPRFEGQEQFKGQILHVNDYKNPQPFENKRVLIVGAGNSAADVAVELGKSSIVAGIVVRDGVDFIPYPKHPWQMVAGAWAARKLPEALVNRLLAPTRNSFPQLGLPPHPQPPLEAYPVVGFKLPQAIEAGRVRPHPGIERLEEHGARFVDGSSAQYDVLILATGYRPTLDFLRDENGALRHVLTDDKGWPQVTESFRSTRRSELYLVGYQYPPWAGWIQNIRRVSQIASDDIAARVKRNSTQKQIARNL